MKVIKPKSIVGNVRLYANVPSETNPGVTYLVCYIRGNHMRRFTCTCPDQNCRAVGFRKNCKHIRKFREQAGV